MTNEELWDCRDRLEKALAWLGSEPETAANHIRKVIEVLKRNEPPWR